MASVASKSVGTSIIASVLYSVSKAFAGIAKTYRARQTRAALYALSDRELADIGLSRGDIYGVSRRID